MTVRYFTKIYQNTVLYARTVVQASDPSPLPPSLVRPIFLKASRKQHCIRHVHNTFLKLKRSRLQPLVNCTTKASINKRYHEIRVLINTTFRSPCTLCLFQWLVPTISIALKCNLFLKENQKCELISCSFTTILF